MKVCITDIHGYLDEALNALQELEDRTELWLLDDREWRSEHKLVLNGDMFDRGSQNKQSLEWVLENADVYNIGNHEFFALFPDVTEDFMSESYFEAHGENGLYWRNMDEEVRHSLIEVVASGKVTAGFKQYNYTYSHSGIRKSYPELSQMNRKLQKTGKKLLEAREEAREGNHSGFEKAQEEIVKAVDTENGKELESKHPSLFNVKRNSKGETTKGGVVWNRFQHLKPEGKQVIGHTRGNYLKQKGLKTNPQWKNQTLNINTVRDSVNGESKIAVTVEDKEGIEVYEL